MLRFSIRDLLWLTLTVALGCALIAAAPAVRVIHAKCVSLENQVRELEEKNRTLGNESAMLMYELEKATNQTVYGWSITPDPSDKQKLNYKVNLGQQTLPRAGPIGEGYLLFSN